MWTLKLMAVPLSVVGMQTCSLMCYSWGLERIKMEYSFGPALQRGWQCSNVFCRLAQSGVVTFNFILWHVPQGTSGCSNHSLFLLYVPLEWGFGHHQPKKTLLARVCLSKLPPPLLCGFGAQYLGKVPKMNSNSNHMQCQQRPDPILFPVLCLYELP